MSLLTLRVLTSSPLGLKPFGLNSAVALSGGRLSGVRVLVIGRRLSGACAVVLRKY